MSARVLDVVVFVGGPLAGRRAVCPAQIWPYVLQGDGGGYVLFPAEGSAGFTVYAWIGPGMLR